MKHFDLQENTVRELNLALHQAGASGAVFEVRNPDGKHNVAAGAMYPGEVNIRGHVGYYCGGMNVHARLNIAGNAGPGLGENMMSGEIVVAGNASQYCGATACGGLLVIKGDAAARCGISLKGLDLVVGGGIGHASAFMAQSGRLVVCGDCGDALGDSIYEARIYVQGRVASLGTDCIEKPMETEHLEELEELLGRAEIKHSAKNFRRYGSARKLYNFQIDNADAY